MQLESKYKTGIHSIWMIFWHSDLILPLLTLILPFLQKPLTYSKTPLRYSRNTPASTQKHNQLAKTNHTSSWQDNLRAAPRPTTSSGSLRKNHQPSIGVEDTYHIYGATTANPQINHRNQPSYLSPRHNKNTKSRYQNSSKLTDEYY